MVLIGQERASLAVSMVAAERDEFATDEEVRVVWAKHGIRVSWREMSLG